METKCRRAEDFVLHVQQGGMPMADTPEKQDAGKMAQPRQNSSEKCGNRSPYFVVMGTRGNLQSYAQVAGANGQNAQCTPIVCKDFAAVVQPRFGFCIPEILWGG